MINESMVEEYIAKVREFAASIGMTDQLESKLAYLSTYANHNGIEKTECVLRKDFAPYSFEFVMYLRERSYQSHKYECNKCGETFSSENDYHNAPCPLASKCDGKLKCVGVKTTYQPRTVWFNGGLIFHGAHDRGGDGSGPTYSVNLVPTHGWEIHT